MVLIMKRHFYRGTSESRIENGLLTKAGRPIIPPKLRKYVADTYHRNAHFGTDKTYELVKPMVLIVKRRFYRGTSVDDSP